MDHTTAQFPDVNFIIAHLGSDLRLLKEFCDLAHRENVYLDTSFLHVYRAIGDAVKMAGAEKLIWGSDGFYMHPVVELAKVRFLKLPQQQEDLILGLNLAGLLGI